MIKDLKFAIKCMKFAYNRKMLSAMSILFIILGIIQFLGGRPISYIMGGIMFVTSPNIFCQLFQTVNMSNLVVSSPKKKVMGIYIVTLLNSLAVLIGYIYFSIAIIIVHYLGKCPTKTIGFQYVILGVMYIVLLTYTAISYKHYILSTVIFITAFLGALTVAVKSNGIDFSRISIPIPIGIGISFGCILIGSFIFAGITKLTYKTPMDKRAMQSCFRGEM